MRLDICLTTGLQDGHLSQSLASSSETVGAGPCLCQDCDLLQLCALLWSREDPSAFCPKKVLTSDTGCLRT